MGLLADMLPTESDWTVLSSATVSMFVSRRFGLYSCGGGPPVLQHDM
jgi:hypothetical protein